MLQCFVILINKLELFYQEGKDSNMNAIPMEEKAFIDKDLENCIMGGDVECTFFLGQAYDLSIVRKNTL